jgi:hypothetical protein
VAGAGVGVGVADDQDGPVPSEDLAPDGVVGEAGAEVVDGERVTEPLTNDAAYAHAPTGRGIAVDGLLVEDAYPPAGAFPDVPEVDEEDLGDDEDDDDPVIVGFDRRTDMWWLLTPLLTILLGPMLAGVVTFFVTEADDGYPRICRPVVEQNGCEEAVLRMLAQHTIAFLVLWLALWALPWWRGLRKYRIALALVAFAVLLLVPLRLVSY